MTRLLTKSLAITILALLLFGVSGCEKSEYYDEATAKGQEQNAGKGTPSEGSGNDDDAPDSNILSVEDFINDEPTEGATVKGYIIGDCTKSFKYAEFEPPFTHEQALLIADTPDERDQDFILAIQLPGGKKRKDLNLVDHPDHLHRKIIISGVWARYLYMAGMKEITYYKIK